MALPLLVFFRKNSIIDRIYLYFIIGLVTFIVLLATYIVYIMYEIIIFLIIAFYADIIEELYFNKKEVYFTVVPDLYPF